MLQIQVRSLTPVAALVALVLAASAFAVDPDSKLFLAGSNRQMLLYTCTRAEEARGSAIELTSKHFDPEGRVALAEEVALETGKIKSYSWHQYQTREQGSMEVTDGRMRFSYTHEGTTKTGDGKFTGDVFVGLTLHQFLRDHWDTILNGGSVEGQWVILPLCRTVGFKFFRTKDTTVNGKGAVVLKTRPSSVFFAAFVDPLFFTFTKDGKELLEVTGRATPKRLVDGKWKEFDTDELFF